MDPAHETPNGVSAEHHQDCGTIPPMPIRNLFAIVALAGFLNRWNDSLTTVTDAEAADWFSDYQRQHGDLAAIDRYRAS